MLRNWLKVYLGAILDLYECRIVSFVIRNNNDNPLVFNTLDAAVVANQDAHPLFHSVRGFQYTNCTFHTKLEKAGMNQTYPVLTPFEKHEQFYPIA